MTTAVLMVYQIMLCDLSSVCRCRHVAKHVLSCLAVCCWLSLVGPGSLGATDNASASTGGRTPELRQGTGYWSPSYSSDEEKWYRVFQEGNFLIGGWQDIMRDVLQVFPPEEQPRQRDRLAVLGERIGREWARDNDIRRIDDGKLRHWGSLLRQAGRKRVPEVMLATIHRIDQEVNHLLGR